MRQGGRRDQAGEGGRTGHERLGNLCPDQYVDLILKAVEADAINNQHFRKARCGSTEGRMERET